MDWLEIGDTALSSLGANKLRSTLMLLGIIIGVAAVIIVVAVGVAGQKRIEKELETFGINSVWIWRDWGDRKTAGESLWTSNNEISNKDVKAIEDQCPYITEIAPSLFVASKVSYQKDEKEARIVGITDSYQRVNSENLVLGRFLTEFDNIYLRKVCVLSFAAKMDLFEKLNNPVGKKVRLNNEKFTVVGVLDKKDRGFLESIRVVSGSGGNVIYLPLSVVQNWYKTKNVNLLQAQALSNNSRFAIEQMEKILSRRHQGRAKFKSETMEQYVQVSNRIMGILSLVLGIIAGISLFVGGLGIMNIMLVSVTERTREIGIRKAIGATKKDIISQFLAESVIISLVGGCVGIILGMLGVGLTSLLANVRGLLSWQPVFVAFFASVLVGIFAGLYPANRAAKLDPIEALRYE